MTLESVPTADVRRAMQDALPGLIEGIQVDERNVLLTLALMWLTASDGEIAPKDVAAESAVAQLDDDKASLVELAMRAYLGQCEDYRRELAREDPERAAEEFLRRVGGVSPDERRTAIAALRARERLNTRAGVQIKPPDDE